MKTFEYRLYINKEQARLLMACLAESRHTYNSMLEMVKQQYEDKQTFPSKYDLEHAFKGQGSEHVPATTVQMLADRLTKSLKRFLAAKQNASIRYGKASETTNARAMAIISSQEDLLPLQK